MEDTDESNDKFIMSQQNLSVFPEISSNIKYVDLRRNQLTKLEFNSSNSIEFIDISDNRIKCIDDINLLRNLKILDVGYNLIDKIPILNLQFLEELYLMSNDIKRIENLNFRFLKRLDIANDEIENIENIFSDELEELYLSSNNIREVSDIRYLNKLRILDLQFNKIEELDCSILPLSIEILLLQNNFRLKEIKNLENLKHLKLIGVKNTVFEDVGFGENVEVW